MLVVLPFWFHGFFIVVSFQHRCCVVLASFFQRFKERLERLVEGIPFEVLNQLRDSVRIGPGFAAVVAGS
jgi:hypothetical protein